jgi:F-type H+-transporting ATPase subunit b
MPVTPLIAAGSALVTPAPGLMIWTLVIFFLSFLVLRRKVFGPIAKAIEDRRAAVRENIESAERSREEALKLLEEYKQQLAASRHEASEIVERARRTAEESARQAKEELRAEKERGIAQVQEAIAAETRQALDQIKNEVADLTLLATEKVVGRALDDKEQRRLIDEALGEVDFSRLRGDG